MAPSPTQFRTTVVRTEHLTPHMVRVVVGGDELADFPDEPWTDRYVKLAFPRPGAEGVPDGSWRELPIEHRPVLRTYTVRHLDTRARELAIDFVVHGDRGVAGPWAAAARPGDELVMSRPGGAYAPRPDAALHLLVGDEAALPAMAAALEAMEPGAPALVLAEVEDVSEELPLPTEAAADVRWLHRADGGGREALVEAVRDLPLPDAGVQAFVHGELHLVRAIARDLRERGLDRDLLSASGYWRRGKDEEGFQAEKRELAAAEAGPAAPG